jgi:hypothetical protein
MLKPLAGIAAITLALAATAAAYTPEKPKTVRMSGTPCSTTLTGPVFTVAHHTWVMRYAASIHCTGGVGEKTLSIAAQVQKRTQHKVQWFTISGSRRSKGPAPVDPLQLSAKRTVFLGHAYRIIGTGHVALTSGETSSATITSGAWAP